ncbi:MULTISPECIES: superoxide dismutase family protein [Sporosarcina]|uniref:superoxide dismutase family protein n=1 Tax=Sporosarcina TaxID=1569 RepID=UPI0005904CA3|nr:MULTISPECIES: superoxide dismutase family protein [Sporosarcina]WJY28368.1 superoxide dismutase family protein [Sporosarcina sp. 0.2-SM1T-5]
MKKTAIFPAFLLMLALGACSADKEDSSAPADETASDDTTTGTENTNEVKPYSVLVDLKDTDGKTTGTAELSETKEGVKVHVEAEGLSPGKHGIHFHETGVCEAPDFKSAGGHFNPADKEHGLDTEGGPHAGDLPNLEVGDDGTVDDEFTTKLVTLQDGKKDSLLKDGGTALVIHAGEDDGESQPSGDSGDRVACGVIN